MDLSRSVLEIGLHSPIVDFKQGVSGTIDVFDILGMNGSITCITSSASKDQASVSRSIMKSRQVKKQRIKLKAIKKGLINEEKEKEGKKS